MDPNVRAKARRAVRRVIEGRPTQNGSLVTLAEGAFVGIDNTIRSAVFVGAGAGINDRLTVIGGGRLAVGPYAAVGRELWVRTVNHDLRRNNLQISLARAINSVEPAISDDVEIGPATWIGDRVTILAGAKIGAGSIVAAGAVVPRVEIPPYTIWGGVPARHIKLRFSKEIIEVLLDCAWWDWDLDRLKRNQAFLDADLTALTPDMVMALIVN